MDDRDIIRWRRLGRKLAEGSTLSEERGEIYVLVEYAGLDADVVANIMLTTPALVTQTVNEVDETLEAAGNLIYSRARTGRGPIHALREIDRLYNLPDDWTRWLSSSENDAAETIYRTADENYVCCCPATTDELDSWSVVWVATNVDITPYRLELDHIAQALDIDLSPELRANLRDRYHDYVAVHLRDFLAGQNHDAATFVWQKQDAEIPTYEWGLEPESRHEIAALFEETFRGLEPDWTSQHTDLLENIWPSAIAGSRPVGGTVRWA